MRRRVKLVLHVVGQETLKAVFRGHLQRHVFFLQTLVGILEKSDVFDCFSENSRFVQLKQ